MRNQSINTNPPKASIGLVENDNSYIIRGNTAEGYVSRSILKSNPEAEQEVRSLLDDMHSHQQAELQDYADRGIDNFNSEYQALLDALDEEFNQAEE